MTRKRIRMLQLGAAALFLVSLFLPYWYLSMAAPSYPEGNLRVNVYATGLTGDIEEWHIVSRLVGVKVPPPTPELDNYLVVAAMVALAALAAIAAMRGRKVALLATAVTWLALLGFLGLMQWHFYQTGHDLDTTAPLRNFVKGGFTPPAIGITTVGSIKSTHLPHVGAIVAGVGAMMLTAAAFPGPTALLAGHTQRVAARVRVAMGSIVTK